MSRPLSADRGYAEVSRLASGRPVLDVQSGHSAELPLVIGHEHELSSHCLRRDQCVERADRRSRSFEFRADSRIRGRIRRVKLDYRQRSQKVLDQPKGFCGGGTLRGPGSELALGDDADCNIIPSLREKILEHDGMLLEGVDADVRVQKELQLNGARLSVPL